jgi:uncharacterized protein YjbJ (UPF0337 family)
MDRDRTAGAAKKVAGSLKKGVGKATHNKRLENEGRAEKVGGKLQNKIGEAKDSLRGKLK